VRIEAQPARHGGRINGELEAAIPLDRRDRIVVRQEAPHGEVERRILEVIG
jgi:hypothetical protein